MRTRTACSVPAATPLRRREREPKGSAHYLEMLAPPFLGHEFLLRSIALRVDIWLHNRTYSSHFGGKLTIINAMW